MQILYWLNKSRVKMDGLCPLYLRITINGEREQFSIKKYVLLKKWDNNGLATKSRTVFLENSI